MVEILDRFNDNIDFKILLDKSQVEFNMLKQQIYSRDINKNLGKIEKHIEWENDWESIVTLIATTFTLIESTAVFYKDFDWEESHNNLRKLILPACTVLINTKLENYKDNIDNPLWNYEIDFEDELNRAIMYWTTISKALSSYINVNSFLEFIMSIEQEFKKTKLKYNK